MAPAPTERMHISPRLWLVARRESPYRDRIERAAIQAGLPLRSVETIEATPPDAEVVVVGPSVRDPLHVARHLRSLGAHPMLVFFTASPSARDALRAELLRDPLLYPRCEVIELPQNERQLATHMGRVVAKVRQRPHPRRGASRPRRLTRAVAPSANGGASREQFLAQVLAATAEAIIATDHDARICTWNGAAQRLFGLPSGSVLGQPIATLDAPDLEGRSSRRIQEIVERVLASSRAEDARVCCRTADDRVTDVDVHVAPIRGPRATLLGAAITARDTSESERVEAALREANRQKDEFLAIMSHELRTPLTSILGYADMLLRGLSGPLPPLTTKYVGNIRSAGDRLLELVNGLLDYTRLEAGVERLDLAPVDLPKLVSQALKHMGTQARAKTIELQLTIEDRAARPVRADEEKLTHVLHSYLGNALKFTPDDGWVSVHVGADPNAADMVRISVTDSGIGMRDEQIARVWERFYQGDASLTRPYGGMGLGLSIARHLVELHGGSVGAESRGPGLGSTFWFSLPLDRASQSAH